MNYRHSDKYSTHTLYNIIILLYIYTYIDIYNIHIHLITSYTQQLQSDNIIYMFGEWFLFRSIHELWLISAFRGGDHYSSGRFEFVRCRLTLDAAVSAACCDSCRCREIGVLVDGYPRARSLPDTDGYELLPAVCSLQKCRVPEVQTFKQFLRKACECHQILNPESGTLSATLAAKNESVSMLS